MLEEKCKPPVTTLSDARGALRLIFREVDIFADYSEEFETDMLRLSWWLLAGIATSFSLSIVTYAWSKEVPTLLYLALFMAGAAGSCASVLARMPGSEVTSSAISVSMSRRLIGRVGTGVAASFAACASLSWGLLPVTVNKLSYADILAACAPSTPTPCSPVYSLILLGIPVVFGFSERILTSLEQRLFGKS